jgi:hypothetical protein
MYRNEAAPNKSHNTLLVLLCLATLVIVVVTILTVTGSGMHEADKLNLSVTSGRPVAEAAETLEQRHGWAVTYEDPLYVHPSELVDVTLEVRRDLDKYKPGEAPKVFVPKGGDVAFEYNIEPATKQPADSAVVVQQLLNAYAQTGHPGIFRLDRDGQRIHIIPIASKEKNGVLATHRSAFDAVITLPAQKRDGLQLLDAFCAAVSAATKTPVVVGAVPMTQFYRYQTESGAKNEKARDFLSNELDRMTKDVKLSWQLLYDPVTKKYFLNIHAVKFHRP